MDKYCKWHRNADKIVVDDENKNRRIGYLINRKYESNIFKKMVGLSDRHWVSIRKINDYYFLLDSKS